MNKIIRYFGILFAGFIIGVIEENARYSIIHHEAKKGDTEAQAIVDSFDEVGERIEEMMK